MIRNKMTRNRTSQGTKLDNQFFYMPLPALLLFLTETWPASKWTAKRLLSPDLWSDKSLIRLPSAIKLFLQEEMKIVPQNILDWIDLYNRTIE